MNRQVRPNCSIIMAKQSSSDWQIYSWILIIFWNQKICIYVQQHASETWFTWTFYVLCSFVFSLCRWEPKRKIRSPHPLPHTIGTSTSWCSMLRFFRKRNSSRYCNLLSIVLISISNHTKTLALQTIMIYNHKLDSPSSSPTHDTTMWCTILARKRNFQFVQYLLDGYMLLSLFLKVAELFKQTVTVYQNYGFQFKSSWTFRKFLFNITTKCISTAEERLLIYTHSVSNPSHGNETFSVRRLRSVNNPSDPFNKLQTFPPLHSILTESLAVLTVEQFVYGI